MAAAPVKSHPLHNFNLPSLLKWGGGRNLGSTSHSRYRRSPLSGAENSEQESDRNDSESDLSHRIGSRTTSNRFSLSSCDTTERRRRQVAAELEKEIIAEGDGDAGEKRDGGVEAEDTVQKPWNLRPRRGVTSSKTQVYDRNGESQETMSIAAAQKVEYQPKSLRHRSLNETVAGEKKEKRKLWIALSKEEIEEDIFVMTGSRPARRPQKRPKNVQKHLDNVFPGLWLVGASTDVFRVPQNPSKR